MKPQNLVHGDLSLLYAGKTIERRVAGSEQGKCTVSIVECVFEVWFGGQ